MTLGHALRVIWEAFCLSNTYRVFSSPVFCQCKGVKTGACSWIFRFLSCPGRMNDWVTVSVPVLWLPSLSTSCHLCVFPYLPTCFPVYPWKYLLGSSRNQSLQYLQGTVVEPPCCTPFWLGACFDCSRIVLEVEAQFSVFALSMGSMPF